ncbi:putative polysaccharide biosynthesis protein [Paenibacillus gansuensis]|uniref:Oligosaccharide flippase family protein n=1 Tax=Paenibacillus gansuensis TaxID=306542 RepID=A0ABW5P8P8_9BACL
MKGAAVLGLAAMASKLIGTLQKIPLQNLAGDAAYGIYNTVYPFYVLLLFISSAGVPIAVSKMVSERHALGDRSGAQDVVKVSLFILSASGLAGFLLLYFGAGLIAGWMGNRKTELAIQSVSFALLIVPMMSVIRGYFQGLGDMMPTGVSQVIEQLIRVATMLGLLLWFLGQHRQDEVIAAGATFGSVTGALAGLGVMLYYWARHHRSIRSVIGGKDLSVMPEERRIGRKQLARTILAYSIPICLGSIALPILSIADSFTMPRLLALQGLSETGVMDRFGEYNRGLPLTQLVAMLASSLSVALVPAIAKAKLRGDKSAVRTQADGAMRMTWLLTLPAAAGLAVLAVPINVMLYTNAEGSATMALLALTAVFSSLNIISGALLQGAGAVKAPAVHLFAAAAAKIGLNLALIPFFGIDGAAAAAVLAFALAAALNLRALAKHTGARTQLRALIRPAAAALAMAAVLLAFQLAWNAAVSAAAPELPARLNMTALALLGIALGAAVYGAVALRTRAVTEAELARVPKSRKLLLILRKLRFLPPSQT